jgi:hypothetical protein
LSDGLGQLSKIEGVQVFPNPTKDRLNFSSENEVIEALSIFDMQGKQVAAIKPYSRNVTMDVAHLSSGLYIATITTPTQVGSMKIVRD